MDSNLANFRYLKIIDYIYFEQSCEININDLKIGDYFVLEFPPSLKSNSRSEKFYGKLLRKTSTTFSCYRYCDSSFNDGTKEFIYKKSIQNYEKSPKKFPKNKIKALHKVNIREKTEKMIFTSNIHPSTFMNPQDFKLIE